MAYSQLPTRTSEDANAASDVNLLQANIEALKGGDGADAPTTDIETMYAAMTAAFGEIMNGAHKGLTVKVNATHTDHQLDVAWTTLWIQGIKTTSFTGTVDITASGALGLDTGSEAANTWYYLWAICKEDGTTSMVLSASSTSPTLPAGYTRKVCISMVRNDGSSNFIGFLQDGKNLRYSVSDISIYSTSSTTLDTGTARDGTAAIPELVRGVYCNSYVDGAKSGSYYQAFAALGGRINGTYCIQSYLGGEDSTSGTYGRAQTQIFIVTDNRYIYGKTSDSTASPTNFYFGISVWGFEVPLGPQLP